MPYFNYSVGAGPECSLQSAQMSPYIFAPQQMLSPSDTASIINSRSLSVIKYKLLNLVNNIFLKGFKKEKVRLYRRRGLKPKLLCDESSAFTPSHFTAWWSYLFMSRKVNLFLSPYKGPKSQAAETRMKSLINYAVAFFSARPSISTKKVMWLNSHNSYQSRVPSEKPFDRLARISPHQVVKRFLTWLRRSLDFSNILSIASGKILSSG